MKFKCLKSKNVFGFIMIVCCFGIYVLKLTNMFGNSKIEERRNFKYVLYWTNFWEYKMHEGALMTNNNCQDGEEIMFSSIWSIQTARRELYEEPIEEERPEFLANPDTMIVPIGFSDNDFATCPISECYATNDKSMLPVDRYDAILFHSPEFCPHSAKPKRRSPHQRYIYASTETPSRMCPHHSLDHFYNWTMSYRMNSDLVWTYGKIVNKINNKNVWPLGEEKWSMADNDNGGREHFGTRSALLSAFRNKTKMVAWLASHCETPSHREDLVKELQKHVPVDIYGNCGELKCSVQYKQRFECLSMLADEYKFYLSFENSICKDYVTEKFFNALGVDIVPVVFGGADYSNIAPPGSYIDASDYQDMEQLGDYLTHLSRTPDEYVRYFVWKKYYNVVSDDWIGLMPLCDLCNKLHNDEKTSIYEDIGEWEGSNDMACNPH